MNIEKIIQIKNIPEKELPEFKTLVIEMIKDVLAQREVTAPPFNLNLLDRIIFTSKYDQELKKIVNEQALGIEIGFTDEAYGRGAAKTLLIPKDGDFFQVIVFDHSHHFQLVHEYTALKRMISIPEIKEELERVSSQKVKKLISTDIGPHIEYTKYIIAHEFGHVHTDSYTIPFLKGKSLKQEFLGKEGFLRPIAEVCWSEYHATFEAAFAVTPHVGEIHLSGFLDTFMENKNRIDKKILEYRWKMISLDELVEYTSNHMGGVLKFCCYVLGWIDGVKECPEGAIEDINDGIRGTYFEKVFIALQNELRQMKLQFPGAWKDRTIYTGLDEVVDLCFNKVGLVMAVITGNQVYIDVPIRPETDPIKNGRPNG